jgi:hypothetical protein
MKIYVKRLLGICGSILLGAACFSCATSIPVRVTKLPRVDMRGIGKIAVLPFEFSYGHPAAASIDLYRLRLLSGYTYKTVLEQQVAQNITQTLRDAIFNTGAFTLIDAQALQKAEDPAVLADAYLTGEVNEFSSRLETRIETGKNAKGEAVERKLIKRTVVLDFTYRVVRAGDGEIITQTHKQGRAESEGERTGTGPAVRSELELAKEIIADQLRYANRDFAPWTTTEYRTLEKDKAKDPRMKDADALVKQGNYTAAVGLYADIYQTTGNFAAGYNAALITEIASQMEQAIERMEQLFKDTGNPKAWSEASRMRQTQAEAEALKNRA